MNIKVPHLRCIVAAAEHRSFRRAAAALNITQPTLSKRIRELEDRLGMLLFERSSGGAQITANGEDFLIIARRVLADLDGMESYAKMTNAGNAGRLNIGFYTPLAGPLRDNVFGFIRQHSQLDLNIIEDDRLALIPLLDRGSIDIALVLGDSAYKDYSHMSLWSERVLVAFHKTHALVERESIYWTDLRNERFIMSLRDPGPELRDILIGKLALPGDQPFIKHVKAHHSAIISAVDGERGVTLICESSSTPSWPGVIFREVRDGNGPTRLGFVAYWRRNNDNPILKQFLSWLQAHPAVPTVHINGPN
ncbi:DNA-binding transcriptional LysR family regulator [Pseudorhodoplanes sinuspersici]|nr:DNA-binding transcriptional LysR family regulator [Pseudorhodoplanes sinuspersici]